MVKNNLPKLPRNLEPKLVFWIDEGKSAIIQTWDDMHVYSFRWNGISIAYESYVIQLREEIN